MHNKWIHDNILFSIEAHSANLRNPKNVCLEISTNNMLIGLHGLFAISFM